MAKEKKTETAVAVAEPALKMVLTRDELYRLVNASYHAHVELSKNPMFAIGNRGNAYRSIAGRMDAAYFKLVDFGMDAVFDVHFYVREKPKDPVDETPAKD